MARAYRVFAAFIPHVTSSPRVNRLSTNPSVIRLPSIQALPSMFSPFLSRERIARVAVSHALAKGLRLSQGAC